MKKSIALILITLSSWKSFSQTATPDTTIKISKEVARAIAKDLVRGDSAIAELKKIQSNYILESQNGKLKDSIISVKTQELNAANSRISLYELELSLRTKQLNESLSLNDDQKKSLRKMKRRSFVRQFFEGAIIAGLTYLLITK